MDSFLRKYLFECILILGLMLSSAGLAKMNPMAFKGIGQYFKPGMEHCSPVWGEIALESGLIHDLRFYGNFQEGRDPQNPLLRSYIHDKSSDPLWNVVKHLFPSPVGQLSPQTIGYWNFGSYVYHPKTVALLLNFAQQVRQYHKRKIRHEVFEKWQTRILESLDQSFLINRFHNSQYADIKDFKKTLKIQAIAPLLKFIEKAIRKENALLYPLHTTEQVITAFFCEKFNTQEDILALLKELDEAIVDHSKPLSVAVDDVEEKDLYTIVFKTNYTPEDILVLANAPRLIAPVPYRTASLLGSGPAYAYDRQKEQILTFSFSDCVEVSARHVMNLLLYDADKREFNLTYIKKYVNEHSPHNPYFANFVRFYEQQPARLANAGDMTMRTLWNMVVGDVNAWGGDAKVRYEKGYNELLPGFVNFIYVFQNIFGLKLDKLPEEHFDTENNRQRSDGIQTNDRIQKSGGIGTSDRIQTSDSIGTSHGIQTSDNIQESDSPEKRWLKRAYETLFKAVNPTKQYDIAVDRLGQLIDGEIDGELPVTVRDGRTGQPLFSFVFYTKRSYHSAILNCHSQPDPSLACEGMLKEYLQSRQPCTMAEILSLWGPDMLVGDFCDRLFHPHRALENNGSHLDVSYLTGVETLMTHYQTWKKEPRFEKRLPILKCTIQHILKQVTAEEDQAENTRRLKMVMEKFNECEDCMSNGPKPLTNSLFKIVPSTPVQDMRDTLHDTF
jgi:hypothetical protein